jgi:hypothetical protein
VRVELYCPRFRRVKPKAMLPYPELADRAWLQHEYVLEGRSGPDIAAELGCSRSSLYEALARHGIARRPPSLSSEYPQLHDRTWLNRAYAAEGRPSDDIAAEIGCHGNTVLRALARHGIPRRRPGNQ